jgi:hypothetical protein
MAEARFEGDSPVARYWLAHCQGFAVHGGAHGVVVDLLRDGDPHLTSRLLVRTRSGRRRAIPVAAVASVTPADKIVTIASRAGKPARRRAVGAKVAHISAPVASVARAAPRGLVESTVAAGRLVKPDVLVLVDSLRVLGIELRDGGRVLYRSAAQIGPLTAAVTAIARERTAASRRRPRTSSRTGSPPPRRAAPRPRRSRG